MTGGMPGVKGPSKAELSRCFAALGVPAYAKEAELRRAYRKLVLSEHPDKGGDPTRFHAIQSAYDTLLAKARSHPRSIPDVREARGSGHTRLVTGGWLFANARTTGDAGIARTGPLIASARSRQPRRVYDA